MSIPIRALIHTVTVSKLITGARGKTYQAPVAVSRVLVQDKTIRQGTTAGYTLINGSLMFWDAQQSDKYDFTVGDRITFNGVDRFIDSIIDATTPQGIHHKELMLL